MTWQAVNNGEQENEIKNLARQPKYERNKSTDLHCGAPQPASLLQVSKHFKKPEIAELQR